MRAVFAANRWWYFPVARLIFEPGPIEFSPIIINHCHDGLGVDHSHLVHLVEIMAAAVVVV